MYLSRVLLNTKKRNTQLALNSINKIHGAIENSFEDKQERVLWRIDRFKGNTYILIVSVTRPNLDEFIEQFGFWGNQAEIKSYDRFLDNIQKGSIWRFRLVANPTKCIKKDSKDSANRGKVVPHITEKYQIEWLVKKSEQLGFHIIENNNNNENVLAARVSASKNLVFRKKQQKNYVRILAVSFEGVLQVDDPEIFKATLCNGIGREKAYGMGMLTVMGI